jgi:hypothetical protein
LPTLSNYWTQQRSIDKTLLPFLIVLSILFKVKTLLHESLKYIII